MTSPESKPGTRTSAFQEGEEVVDEVFLTPRVLDQGAFRAYSESLKGLIREANGRRNDLRGDAEDARQLCENLTETAARLRERLETTAKLLPTLDDRVKRAEKLLDHAADRSQLPERIEALVTQGMEELERRISEAVARAEARLREVEERYERVRAASEESVRTLEAVRLGLDETSSLATAKLDELTAEIARVEARAVAATEALTTTLDERTSQMQSRIEQACVSAEVRVEKTCQEAQQRVESGCSHMEERVERAAMGAEQRISEVESRAEELQERAERIRERFIEQVDESMSRLNGVTAETAKKISAIELITERAVRLLGFDPSNPGDEIAPDSLMMLVQRGDALERQVGQTGRELRELHELSARVRDELRSCVRDSAEKLEVLEQSGNELVRSMEGTIGPLCEQSTALLEQIISARDLLDELAEQQSGLGEHFEQVRTRALDELTALRELAGKELSRIQLAIAAQKRSLERLGSAPSEGEGSNQSKSPDSQDSAEND